MNRVLLVVMLMIFVKLLPAQEFISQGASPDLYLDHQVAPKETWFAIGRKYNLPPGEIATYNKQTTQTPLEIGQSVKIPLTASNFTQNENKESGEVLVPVYHVVQDKEWMYRISVNHNKVPIEKLEKWNAISRDEAKAGMKLIVGHLRVKEGNAVASANTVSKPNPPATQAQPATKTNTPTAAAPPSTRSGGSQAGTVQQNPATAGASGGYFKSQYAGGAKNQSGVAGIFKSTSGWNDKKYYALMNNVTVGTIVRINFPQTNKSVYAKVLGELPEMKESAGLALRISDAAANELGATTGKFSVEVVF